MSQPVRVLRAVCLAGMALTLGCASGPMKPEDRAAGSPVPTRTLTPSVRPGGSLLTSTPLAPGTRPGELASVHGSGDGTLAVTFTPASGLRSTYRVFDEDGRALTPMLDVPSVDVRAGFDGGVVGEFYLNDPARPERTVQQGWITLDREGRLEQVRTSTRTRVLGPGDVLVTGDLTPDTPEADPALLAFRPAERMLSAVPVPPDSHEFSWMQDNRGWLWGCPAGGSAGEILWSSDGARTWHETQYSFEPAPGGSQRWTTTCHAAGGVLVMLALRDDLPVGYATFAIQDEQTHTAALIPFGRRLNMYGSGILADGRLVFGTNRPGVQLAADAGNDRFVFWPGPALVSSWPWAVDDRLAIVDGRRLWVTGDGIRWQEVDVVQRTPR